MVNIAHIIIGSPRGAPEDQSGHGIFVVWPPREGPIACALAPLYHRDGLAIVRAVTVLSSSLGLATTAEGIETREQAEVIGSPTEVGRSHPALGGSALCLILPLRYLSIGPLRHANPIATHQTSFRVQVAYRGARNR